MTDYNRSYDTSNPTAGNIDAAIRAGIAIGGAEPKTPYPDAASIPEGVEEVPFVIVPQGHQVQSLAAQVLREFPRRRTATVSLGDAASFIEYVTAFKLPETRIFADPKSDVLTAIFDYHQAGAEGQPRWGAHRATLTLAHTEAWTRWTAMDGKKVDQLEFAEFVEDNLMDIADPDGSTILQVSRSLEATKNIGFKSALRLDNGQSQLSYVEQIDGSAQVDNRSVQIPEKFIVAVIPFDGGELQYRLEARLRYRIAQGGKLSIGFDLLRPDLIEDDAFKKTLATIGEKVGLPILRGTAPVAFQ